MYIKVYDAETGKWHKHKMTDAEYAEYMKQFEDLPEE